MILHRLNLLFTGRWLELWQLCFWPSISLPKQDRHEHKLTPGLVTGEQARAVQMAVRVGQVTRAWRQLWSFGSVSKTFEGSARIRAKLNDAAMPVASDPVLPLSGD